MDANERLELIALQHKITEVKLQITRCKGWSKEKIELREQLYRLRDRYHFLQTIFLAAGKPKLHECENQSGSTPLPTSEIIRCGLNKGTPNNKATKEVVYAHPQFIRLQLVELAIQQELSRSTKTRVYNAAHRLQKRLDDGEQVLDHRIKEDFEGN